MYKGLIIIDGKGHILFDFLTVRRLLFKAEPDTRKLVILMTRLFLLKLILVKGE